MTSDQNKYTCLVDAGGQISSMPLEHAKELGLEIFDEYGNIVKTTSTKKKSRYDAKHRIKDSSKLLRSRPSGDSLNHDPLGLQKQLKSLENRFDILDDDLIELKWEIDDIKKKLSDMKCTVSLKSKSKTKHICNTSSGSEFEYEEKNLQ